jgi:antitoxin FitA
MNSITIRNLDPGLKELLRVRAARHGHSMEAEARTILRETLTGGGGKTGADLLASIRGRFAPLGGVDLEPPPRGPAREPPRFE